MTAAWWPFGITFLFFGDWFPFFSRINQVVKNIGPDVLCRTKSNRWRKDHATKLLQNEQLMNEYLCFYSESVPHCPATLFIVWMQSVVINVEEAKADLQRKIAKSWRLLLKQCTHLKHKNGNIKAANNMEFKCLELRLLFLSETQSACLLTNAQ